MDFSVGGLHSGQVLTGCEGKSVIAEFAKFLFRISKPLQKTFLVNVFDRAGANTRMKEGPVGGSFAAADATDV